MRLATTIKAIEEIAAEIGGTVRDDYSGRGMFGKTCYAIECDDEVACIWRCEDRGILPAHWDHLGKGFIVYFPSMRTEVK